MLEVNTPASQPLSRSRFLVNSNSETITIIIVKVLQIKQMKVKSNLFHTTMGKKHNMITVNPLMDQLWKLRENVVRETTVQLQLRQTHKQFSQTTLNCSINLNISNK